MRLLEGPEVGAGAESYADHLRRLGGVPDPGPGFIGTLQRGGLVTFAAAPARYVAGAEAAAIHFLNEGVATPTTVPPYPFERGVGGAPTLVQNVETLARVASLARPGGAASTLLLTLAGGVAA